MTAADLSRQVDELIAGPPYGLGEAARREKLLSLLRPLAAAMGEACPEYGRFLAKLGPPAGWTSLLEAPPLPVTLFKRHALRAVPESEVVRELRSSGTAGDASRIFVDKPTAFRQARALSSILKAHLGGHRRPYLVIDSEDSLGGGEALTARGAAIRGLLPYATETTFALRKTASSDLVPDWDAVEAFLARNGSGPVLAFGFTYLVFTRFVEEAERRGLRFSAPRTTLVHSGGWKKLQALAISKDELSARAAAVLGCRAEAVLDFYGMVEEVGVVFVDCEAGRKHSPAFAAALIRRPGSLEEALPGEEGLLEIVSVLPTSYPGLAVMTEDQGIVTGVDDCPCGRPGQTFRFTRRVERAAVRGCGDTFAQGAP